MDQQPYCRLIEDLKVIDQDVIFDSIQCDDMVSIFMLSHTAKRRLKEHYRNGEATVKRVDFHF